jgi:hypothetical protein
MFGPQPPFNRRQIDAAQLHQTDGVNSFCSTDHIFFSLDI